MTVESVTPLTMHPQVLHSQLLVLLELLLLVFLVLLVLVVELAELVLVVQLFLMAYTVE
jgi:hypothetical protein